METPTTMRVSLTTGFLKKKKKKGCFLQLKKENGHFQGTEFRPDTYTSEWAKKKQCLRKWVSRRSCTTQRSRGSRGPEYFLFLSAGTTAVCGKGTSVVAQLKRVKLIMCTTSVPWTRGLVKSLPVLSLSLVPRLLLVEFPEYRHHDVAVIFPFGYWLLLAIVVTVTSLFCPSQGPIP